MQTDEIFTASFQVTNMVYFLKLMGTKIHDTIKMCLYCTENKIMTGDLKKASSSSQGNANI